MPPEIRPPLCKGGQGGRGELRLPHSPIFHSSHLTQRSNRVQTKSSSFSTQPSIRCPLTSEILEHRPPRHYRECGNQVSFAIPQRRWMPTCAGMTGLVERVRTLIGLTEICTTSLHPRTVIRSRLDTIAPPGCGAWRRACRPAVRSGRGSRHVLPVLPLLPRAWSSCVVAAAAPDP